MTNATRQSAHAARETHEPDGAPSVQTKLTTAGLAELVATLEATGDYRVLQRLVPLPFCADNPAPDCAARSL